MEVVMALASDIFHLMEDPLGVLSCTREVCDLYAWRMNGDIARVREGISICIRSSQLNYRSDGVEVERFHCGWSVGVDRNLGGVRAQLWS